MFGVNGCVFVFELVVDVIIDCKLLLVVLVLCFLLNCCDIVIMVKDEVCVGNVFFYIENIGVN